MGAIPTLALIPASTSFVSARSRCRGGAVPGSVVRQTSSSRVGTEKVTETSVRRAASWSTSRSRTISGPRVMTENGVAARAAGATGVWANLLYLRPGTKEHFLESLARDWPEELRRYEELYAGGAYLPRSEVEPIREHVRALAREHGVRDRRRIKLTAPPEPVQLSLGV